MAARGVGGAAQRLFPGARRARAAGLCLLRLRQRSRQFALGFRIDPILAALNLAWGLAGTYIGFFRPRYAIVFVLAFAAFYTVLAVLGSFTPHHLGMLLNDRVNMFHWAIVPVAWAIGLYALWQRRRLP